MGWYSALVLYESSIESDVPDPDPLRESSVVVFQADSEEEARRKAVDVGKNAECDYRNCYGELVSWVFLRVVEVQDLCKESLCDGVEVFSWMRRVSSRRDACRLCPLDGDPEGGA